MRLSGSAKDRCVERGMFVHCFFLGWSFRARATSVKIVQDGLEK